MEFRLCFLGLDFFGFCLIPPKGNALPTIGHSLEVTKKARVGIPAPWAHSIHDSLHIINTEKMGQSDKLFFEFFDFVDSAEMASAFESLF